LICPNTGSIVWPLFLYILRPACVSSLRSMRSLIVRCLGIRPRGAGLSRNALRCYGKRAPCLATCDISSKIRSGPDLPKCEAGWCPEVRNASRQLSILSQGR
jgi:hypothetical protein